MGPLSHRLSMNIHQNFLYVSSVWEGSIIFHDHQKWDVPQENPAGVHTAKSVTTVFVDQKNCEKRMQRMRHHMPHIDLCLVRHPPSSNAYTNRSREDMMLQQQYPISAPSRWMANASIQPGIPSGLTPGNLHHMWQQGQVWIQQH
jgi:hypothetical protein